MAAKLKMASPQIQLLPNYIFGVKVHERLPKKLGCHGYTWKIYWKSSQGDSPKINMVPRGGGGGGGGGGWRHLHRNLT